MRFSPKSALAVHVYAQYIYIGLVIAVAWPEREHHRSTQTKTATIMMNWTTGTSTHSLHTHTLTHTKRITRWKEYTQFIGINQGLIYIYFHLSGFFSYILCVCVYASYYYMVYHIDFVCTQIRVCYAISYCIVWIEREKESSLAHNCGVKWSNEKLPYISKTIIIRVSV